MKLIKTFLDSSSILLASTKHTGAYRIRQDWRERQSLPAETTGRAGGGSHCYSIHGPRVLTRSERTAKPINDNTNSDARMPMMPFPMQRMPEFALALAA